MRVLVDDYFRVRENLYEVLYWFGATVFICGHVKFLDRRKNSGFYTRRIGNQLSMNEPGQKWTQDESIAFECACDCIVNMIAICTDELHNEAPTEVRRTELEAEIRRLAAERRVLHLHNIADIERIRRDYGQRIRSHYASTKSII